MSHAAVIHPSGPASTKWAALPLADAKSHLIYSRTHFLGAGVRHKGCMPSTRTWLIAEDRLIDWVKVLRPIRFQRRSPSQSLGLVWKKLNLTQNKHTFTNQKKCTTTQNKHKKTKARFSRLSWHPAWKRRGSILIWCFVNLSLTYLQTGTHSGPLKNELHLVNERHPAIHP